MFRLRAIVSLALLALAITACGSTEPEDPRADGGLLIRLAQVPEHADVQVVDDAVFSSCPVTFKGIRRTELSVSLLAMKAVYYSDAGLQQPFDSITVAGDSVAARWDGPLTLDNQPRAPWTFTARRPFYLRIRFRYLWGGAAFDTPDLKFHCAPEGQGDGSGPSLSNLTVTPSDTLNPYDSLVVRYRLEATRGSWQEFIRVKGTTCDTVVQRSTPLVRVLDREAAILLPWECRMGTRLSVSVRATDLSQRSTTHASPDTVILLDNKRPTLTGGPITGEFALGQTLQFTVRPNDNYRLTYLYWIVEPFGFRDSTSAFNGNVTVRIIGRPEWSGSLQIKLWARDSMGLVSDTLRSVPDSVRIIPTVNRPVVARPFSGQIRTVSFDTKRDRIYVLRDLGLDSSRVAVLAGPSYTEVANYPVQGTPFTMDITPSSDTLLIGAGASATLGIIDLTAATPVNQVFPLSHSRLPAGGLWNVLAAANGRAYIGTLFAMVEVTLADRSTRLIRDDHSYLTVRSGDGSLFVRGSGDGVNTTSLMRPGETEFYAALPNTDGSRSVNGDGSRLNVGLKVYNGNLGLVSSGFAAGLTAPVDDIRISPDGTVLAYLDPSRSGLVRMSVATGRVMDRTPLPFGSFGNTFLRYSPDGTKVVAGISGNVVIIDMTQPGGVSGSR